MEAIHLGDPGFFIFITSGIRYFIWRRVCFSHRLRKRGILQNGYGTIPTFKLNFKDANFNTMLNTYAYIYDSWFMHAFGTDATGLVDGEKVWEEKFGRLTAAQNNNMDSATATRRVDYFFAIAAQKWQIHPSRCETEAYLEASTMAWFDDAFEIGELPKVTRHKAGIYAAEAVFLAKPEDILDDATKGHVERDRVLRFGYPDKTRWPEPRSHMSPVEVVLESAFRRLEDWFRVPEEDCKAMAEFFDFSQASGDWDGISENEGTSDIQDPAGKESTEIEMRAFREDWDEAVDAGKVRNKRRDTPELDVNMAFDGVAKRDFAFDVATPC